MSTNHPSDSAYPPSREEALNSAQDILATYARAYQVELPRIFAQMRRCLQNLAEPEMASSSLSLLRRDAHDMKGQGSMFGLPHVSQAAGDFCDLLAGYEPETAEPALIELYIGGLQKLSTLDVDLAGDEAAEALIARLRNECGRSFDKAISDRI